MELVRELFSNRLLAHAEMCHTQLQYFSSLPLKLLYCVSNRPGKQQQKMLLRRDLKQGRNRCRSIQTASYANSLHIQCSFSKKRRLHKYLINVTAEEFDQLRIICISETAQGPYALWREGLCFAQIPYFSIHSQTCKFMNSPSWPPT